MTTDLADSYRELDLQHRCIVALDVGDAESAARLVDRLGGDLSFVKVGLELFAAAGPAIVEDLRSRGLSVFLDLKFHDIPNTMAGAARSAAALGADFCTVHALAGEGVAAAAKAGRDRQGRPLAILAVTVLTSHAPDELPGLVRSRVDNSELVLRLGQRSCDLGAAGLITSPLEVARLREALGPGPLLVTPGIRPAGSEVGDQARVATPAAAMGDGADFLVIGRPITKAPDPAGELARILDEMASAQ